MKAEVVSAGLSFVILSIIVLTIFLLIPSAWNPLTPRGEVVGEFIDGSHHGYGNECGQYPGSNIRFRNATWDRKHFIGENGVVNTYYGNQWKDVDKMKAGVRYRVWYHEGSRPSDASSGNNIYYWVVDGYEMVKY